jgi:hypothetical protein
MFFVVLYVEVPSSMQEFACSHERLVVHAPVGEERP